MKIYSILTVLFILAISTFAQTDINELLNNNSSDSQYAAQIRIAKMRQKLAAQQQAKPNSPAQQVSETTVKLHLDEFSHALDIRLVDKLSAANLFSVVEDKDLRETLRSAVAGATDLPTPESQRRNRRNPK